MIEVARIDFPRRIVAGFEFAHPARIDVEADHGRTRPAERHGHGKTYIAQPNNRDFPQRNPPFKYWKPRAPLIMDGLGRKRWHAVKRKAGFKVGRWRNLRSSRSCQWFQGEVIATAVGKQV